MRFPLQGAVSIETSYISFDDRFAAQIVYLAIARKGAGGFFGALDFSPLRHSPALAGREHYITKPPRVVRRNLKKSGRSGSVAK